jgi:MGT family glycosyltransferase
VSRYLFAVPPLTGHINPAAAVAAELARRGHDVAWVGFAEALRPLVPADAQIFPVPHEYSRNMLRDLGDRWMRLNGTAELKFFWEEFLIPLGHVMLPTTLAAIDTYRPDVVVSDQQALAGALAARLTRLPWATSAITSSELVSPLRAMPKVDAWVSECMAEFQRAHGVPDPIDLRWSDQLVLIYTTLALTGPLDWVPERCVLTGPVITDRPNTTPFPWDWLDPARRKVLVSLGTLNVDAGGRFFREVLDAVAEERERLQLIIVASPESIGPTAPHILVRASVPQLPLLARVDAVVCHAGHNTVAEALAHGLPLVAAPIRDDQPIVAQQVANAGAGIRVKFSRVRAPELRAALLAVLDDPSYRAGARKVQASFAAAGGVVTAADHLEKLTVGAPAGTGAGRQ